MVSGVTFGNLTSLAHGLQSGQVDSVILDINVAGYRRDLFDDSWCKVSKVISYPFSFGVAVSQNAVKLEKLFRTYLKDHQSKLARFAKDVIKINNTSNKEVCIFLTGNINQYRWTWLGFEPV